MSRYYHAGVQVTQDRFVWSNHTRRTRTAAEREALSMARKHGGRGIVEYWDRHHGLRPADQELVQGADFVGEEAQR